MDKCIVLLIMAFFSSMVLKAEQKTIKVDSNFTFEVIRAMPEYDTIIVKKTFCGHKYYINGVEYSTDHLVGVLGLLSSTKKLHDLYESNTKNSNLFLTIGAITTAKIIYNYATSPRNKSDYLTSYNFYIFAEANVALYGLSIMFYQRANTKLKQAIEIYNIPTPKSEKTSELLFNIELNRINLTYKF